MVERDNLIESPYEVFDNTQGLREYYQRITYPIPFTEATFQWFIARGGSGKSTEAQQFTLKVRNDDALKERVRERWLLKQLPEGWKDYLTIKYLVYDQCLALAKDRAGSIWEAQEKRGLVFAAASELMGTSIQWARENLDRPFLLTLDLPVLPHRRDTGRTMMHMMIQGRNMHPGEIHRIIAVRPDQALRELALEEREMLEKKALGSLDSAERDKLERKLKSMASSAITELAYQEELDLIEELINRGELSADLAGFRNDPEKEDKAAEALHILECRRALGEHQEEYYRVVKNIKLPIPTHSYKDIFDRKDGEYALPLEQIAEEIFGPKGLGTFEFYLKPTPPSLRVFFPSPSTPTRSEKKKHHLIP